MSATTRREFIRIGAAGVLAGAGAGAWTQVSRGPAGAHAARGESLAQLARRLRGPLVLPGQPDYPAAAQVWNPRFDFIQPRAIAFCETAHDVAEVIHFARVNRWQIAARSGRHSFEGYCNVPGIVADVSRMDSVSLDRRSGVVRVGAGVDVYDHYSKLVLAQGRSVPVGTCPTVGIAGLTLGGGFGRLMRLRGLTQDNVLEVELVLADGSVVRASESHNRDLFWACRGGGGGNFGIATSFRMRSYPVSQMTGFGFTWDWSRGVDVVDAWQRSAPFAPAQMSFSGLRAVKSPNTSGGYTLRLSVGGVYFGTPDQAREALAPLLATNPTSASIRERPANLVLLPDGCTPPGVDPPHCVVTRNPNYQRSDFISRPMSRTGIATLLQGIERWPGASAGEGGVQIEAFGPGSAINRISPSATAFIHRNTLAHIVYLNFWGSNDPVRVARANIRWAIDTYAAMRPYVSGFAYQNYIDRLLRTWPHAYYGANYPRLQRIKARYDRHNLFRFAQSIRPAGRPFTG